MCPSPSDVSIITINWNGRDHLESLLPTLENLGSHEIIVVDNGSSDDSVAFIRKNFPATKLITNPSNKGFAHPCNAAAQTATGRYLAFINNDMRADSGWLTGALRHLNEKTPCVASRILNWEGTRIDYNGSSLQYLGYALQRDIGELLEDVGCEDRVLFACGGAMIIKRSAYLDAGGFDEDFFAVYEDVDLGWRLWLAGHEIAFAPESIVYHRGHATFNTLDNAKMRYLMHRNALLTIFKNYGEETFRKVLPLAVVLAVKRAIHFSGVEKERFYLWGETEQRLQWDDSAFRNRLLDSMNHLVAVDDVLEMLPTILEKRSHIQAMRKRSDKEILSMFVDPFRTIVADAEYQISEQAHLRLLDLASQFEANALDQSAASLPDLLSHKIERLKSEMSGLQWLDGHSRQTVPLSGSTGLRKFLRAWKKEGFPVAWKRFVEHINRGL